MGKLCLGRDTRHDSAVKGPGNFVEKNKMRLGERWPGQTDRQTDRLECSKIQEAGWVERVGYSTVDRQSEESHRARARAEQIRRDQSDLERRCK